MSKSRLLLLLALFSAGLLGAHLLVFSRVSQCNITPVAEIPLVSYYASRLDLPHNSRETVGREVLNPDLIRLAAQAGGLNKSDLKNIDRLQRTGTVLHEVTTSRRASDILAKQLHMYEHARAEGHTKEFVAAALRDRASRQPPTDPILRLLITNESLIATSWLRREQSGVRTNIAGREDSRRTWTTLVNGKEVTNVVVNIPKVDEICPWFTYVAIDGEIAWRYFIQCKTDGSLDHLRTSRFDAQEADPKYRDMIKSVTDQVTAQMKKEGRLGKFGSIHTFWDLKQQELKKRGVHWRSPKELNPNFRYD